MNNYDAIVIGAGLSGLAAARNLVERGLSVVVLEARNRVGGRTYSPQLEGSRIDLGAQWIGPTQDRVRALVREFGLDTHQQYRAGKNLAAFGDDLRRFRRILPPLRLRESLELGVHYLRWSALSRKSGSTLSVPESKLQRRLDSMSVADDLQGRIRTDDGRALLDAAVQMIIGADTDEISFLHFLRYLKSGGGFRRVAEVEGGGQDTRIVGGTQQISERLAKSIGDALVLEHAVERVVWSDDAVTVAAGGREFLGSRLIFAAAPPMMEKIAFSPALPDWRSNLNRGLRMGSVLKAVVRYKEPFWREQGVSGESIIPEGPVRAAFDNLYAEDDAPSLVTFSIGRAARKLGALETSERRRVIESVLARLFGDAARDSVAYVDKDWVADPWSMGCYAAYAPPQLLCSSAHSIGEPIGALHFAGTETALKWCGYMDGALEAGERAAEEVWAALHVSGPSAQRSSLRTASSSSESASPQCGSEGSTGAHKRSMVGP